jgi:hypothetical protein
MNSFQRKSLYAALAGAGALGVAATAQAVSVNPNGLGQVLIYPYYTVNSNSAGAYNSLLSVVNTTDSVKAVKVRFLEGKNSREVLDFNLFLSKRDVWTAAVIPSSTTTGGRLITFDNSCTIPDGVVKAGIDFLNYAYTGTADDKGGSGLDRTREGYVELIEMATYTTSNCISINATHVGGTPKDCSSLSDGLAATFATYATGGLFGGMSLINVSGGTDFTEDAIALVNFNTGPIYFATGSLFPNLSQAGPAVSTVYAADPRNGFFAKGDRGPGFATSDLGVYVSRWPSAIYNTADPVSASLMHEFINNEFVVDTAVKAGTDWVITFPTKRFYVNVGTGSATKLFQRNFNGTAGSCDDVSLKIFDREERTTSSPVTVSPPPPTPGTSICWEVNVLTFNATNVLASFNNSSISTNFASGWLKLGFVTSTAASLHKLGNSTFTTHIYHASFVSTGLTKTYLGLPVIGFAVQSFTNGTLTVGGSTVLSNYGGNFVHKTNTRIIN